MRGFVVGVKAFAGYAQAGGRIAFQEFDLLVVWRGVERCGGEDIDGNAATGPHEDRRRSGGSPAGTSRSGSNRYELKPTSARSEVSPEAGQVRMSPQRRSRRARVARDSEARRAAARSQHGGRGIHAGDLETPPGEGYGQTPGTNGEFEQSRPQTAPFGDPEVQFGPVALRILEIVDRRGRVISGFAKWRGCGQSRHVTCQSRLAAERRQSAPA